MRLTRQMKLQPVLLLADILDGEVTDVEVPSEFCKMLATKEGYWL